MTSSDAPLVSVVVPCYNTELYIGEAIDSIVAQDCKPIEIVVIDDGSTDRSMEVVRRFGDRVECRRQPNAGIGAARNAGIAIARGKYLAFLDADDIWTPTSLNSRLDRLRRGADCVYGGVEHFISPDLSPEERDRFAPIPATMTGRLAGTMLIDRNAFHRVGLFDPSLKIGEMVDWVARADHARIAAALIDDIVLRRRIHRTNTVLRLRDQQGAYLKALRASLTRRRDAASKQGDGT
jgi:glycosyltransferase involved in cell wall biosynthesis